MITKNSSGLSSVLTYAGIATLRMTDLTTHTVSTEYARWHSHDILLLIRTLTTRITETAESRMIKTVADFLLQLKREEERRLDSVDLSHAPTIGDMYEGLSKDLLNRAVPEALGLQLVSGFISDGLGHLSGQIDCMLVSGRGERIPYTNNYKWHVKNVIAVLEIKKTLYGDDLADAMAQLYTVREREADYMQSLRNDEDIVDIRSAQRAFAETTGFLAPSSDKINSLSPRDQLILHTLILEQVGVIRVIFGYHGFRTERGFRQSLVSYLQRHMGTHGSGVHSFPQLIISGTYSLGKANGQPFSAPLVDGQWPFYYSASINPLQLLLEYIWTRLARDFDIGGLWGEDLTLESLHSFLLATVEEGNGRAVGWNYEYYNASEAELAAARDFVEWEPVRLSAEQLVVIRLLCEGGTVRFDDPSLLAFLTDEGIDIDQFKHDLLQTRLVAISGNGLELITERCQCAILPNGEFIAGEDNTGRLTRWMQRYMQGIQQRTV